MKPGIKEYAPVLAAANRASAWSACLRTLDSLSWRFPRDLQRLPEIAQSPIHPNQNLSFSSINPGVRGDNTLLSATPSVSEHHTLRPGDNERFVGRSAGDDTVVMALSCWLEAIRRGGEWVKALTVFRKARGMGIPLSNLILTTNALSCTLEGIPVFPLLSATPSQKRARTLSMAPFLKLTAEIRDSGLIPDGVVNRVILQGYQ
eukprot:CAMPEP_0184496486 /NCGR_PEP_ID=MMETSP0113_2-20130426/34073_1 /TAXON_ID=91329 /ORGANISM="Norrisiella sphaerica, Strain BC52" /LENGTH=203 /DNA_ID=CAMNT_0026883123 /DNA_START=166 /DNA_END=774 /DNA_ORIENTATION=+